MTLKEEPMKVVVSDCDHKSMDIEKDVLKTVDLQIEHLDCKTEKDVISHCDGANIVLNQYAPFTERVFSELAPHLGLIVRYGVGVDNIDLDAATRHGVQICNIPDYGMNEVSDHALGLMLALVRKIPFITELTREGVWDFRRTIPVRRVQEMTIGVLGVGRIGGLFAHKVSALGCRVLLCDPYKDNLAAEISGAHEVSFDNLLAQSDLISVHCPLSEETRGLLGANAISKMKPGAMLINTARGGIVDEAALANALNSGHISGAAIDTVEREPLASSSQLLAMQNCLVTPHMAYYSEESSEELKRKVAEEAVRFSQNESVHYPVNDPVRTELEQLN
ncbi:C-terminal binding protein [Pseudovibrio exalbescens]|uniref:C-terminal binding protein n=1 Tax=Pseudovibrio exalbescens TaxID=197461 RepID=UPI001AD8A0B2|nr:C-terminal binding protein [Pseudovibrio exalbescens]